MDSTNWRPLKKRNAHVRRESERTYGSGYRLILIMLAILASTLAANDCRADDRPAPKKAVSSFQNGILPLNWEFFVAIGRCEQPGNGRWGIDWDHPGSTYPGGLGVYLPLWYEKGIDGTDLAPSPDKATPVEQMIQAQRIIDKYGVYAWGCTGVALASAPFYD